MLCKLVYPWESVSEIQSIKELLAWPGKKLLEKWMTYVTYASARNCDRCSSAVLSCEDTIGVV